jgi:hypothetical protein
VVSDPAKNKEEKEVNVPVLPLKQKIPSDDAKALQAII